MTFTDPNFLYLFFPIFFIFYFLSKNQVKPIIILVSSIFFYAINNLLYLPFILFLIWGNLFVGKKIARNQNAKHNWPLLIGILVNFSFLFLFKFANIVREGYLSNFHLLTNSRFIQNIVIPLGFSYFTFQNISYLVDINNEVCQPELKFVTYANYTLFFPKIFVGPIMRYGNMVLDIDHPKVDVSSAAEGMRRFIVGLAKKILIADTIARAINPSFDLGSPEFSTGIAWFMIVGYSIQLYYDFSGFTDMAIGMGQMMGINLVENFNFPYIAESITDFWRRWHISLSSWVRDYIFTPLEFKRRRVKFARQQTHIILAFLVVGLWHGMTPNFIIWGLLNGTFLALEMTFLAKILKKVWKPIRHIYTMIFLVISWTIFRSDTLAYAINFLGRLIGLGGEPVTLPFLLINPLPIIDPSVWLVLIIGILFAIPNIPFVVDKFRSSQPKTMLLKVGYIAYDLGLVFLLILSIASMVSSTAVRNIYGGF